MASILNVVLSLNGSRIADAQQADLQTHQSLVVTGTQWVRGPRGGLDYLQVIVDLKGTVDTAVFRGTYKIVKIGGDLTTVTLEPATSGRSTIE